MKNENPEYYNILTKTKVRFKFIDKEVVLEDWSELIRLDEEKIQTGEIQSSFRLCTYFREKELDLYYKARKKLSHLYNSDKYRIEFKLKEKRSSYDG